MCLLGACDFKCATVTHACMCSHGAALGGGGVTTSAVGVYSALSGTSIRIPTVHAKMEEQVTS